MFTRIALCIPLLSVTLLAQSADRMSDPKVLQRIDVTRNAGLQPDGPGRLFGGGADYCVLFTTGGMRLLPALGPTVATMQHLQLRPLSVRRGATVLVEGPLSTSPVQKDRTASYAHAVGIEERHDVGVDGVELSWHFKQRPAGSDDLVVRYALDTSLPAPQRGPNGGLEFLIPEIGGVTIGGVTGIDANGAAVAGELRYQAGNLEMTLPAGFVDAAAYPIVLDPVVGPRISVAAGTWNDAEPDIAFDASTGGYLVTFLRTFSASDIWPRAQRMSGGGALLGSTIFFAANGICGRARVGNLPSRDRFGVVFAEQDGIFNGIKFAAVHAGTGTITHTSIVASSTGVDLFLDPDIGGDSSAPLGSNRGFVVVFEDNIQNEIRARRISFDALDQLVSPTAHTVFADTGGVGSSYTQPAIARAAGSDSRLLVVARRFSGLGPFVSIYATVVTSGSTAVGPTVSLGGSQTALITVPDVDGFEGAWIVAWQQSTTTTSAPSVVSRTVHLDGSVLALGGNQTLGGTTFSQASAPTLGWAPGRTWLGHRHNTPVAGGTSLRALAIDSGSALSCVDLFSEVIASADKRIVVATGTSGGQPSDEDAMAVFGESNQIYAQRLRNYGGGTFTDLGGACGAGGSQSFSHAPGIGSSSLSCTVFSLPPTALATIFNFSTPAVALPCAACVWTPFSVTQSASISGGQASVQFPIPCLQSLVGLQFETQWTTIDFAEAPCPLFPGLAVSNRMLLMLGQ